MSTINKPFTISGIFDANNNYTITEIKINNDAIDVSITQTTDIDVLTDIKTKIADLLIVKEPVSEQETQGGRRKTSKRKYKNNKRK
jgi:hypothetical protein